LKPIYLHPKSKDESFTVSEVFDDLVYQPSWFHLEAKEIKKIVDIGALIGAFSLWAHEKWPKALIYSYEPDPNSFNYFLKNVKAAKAEKRIHVNNCAIWKTTGTLKLHRFENTPGSNSVVFKERPFVGEYKESINIKTLSMKKIISEIGTIDFLKIDCEGAEYDILYSLSKNDLKKIRNVAIEYHEFDNNKKHKGLALSNHLRKNGFITQIIPTDIHPAQGLGYIYASRIIKEKKLEVVFDDFTKSVLKLHRLANEREMYVKDLDYALKEKVVQINSLQELASEKERYAVDLENSIKEKTDEINSLQELYPERDRYATELENSVKEKTDEINSLQELASEKERYATDLENSVKEKTDEIISLQELASEKERYAIDLENSIKEKTDEIISLQEFASENDEKIAKFQDTVLNKEVQFIEIRDQLSEIEKSVMFRIMRNLGKKIDSMFPNETKKGEFKKITAASFSIIATKGFKDYLSKVRTKLKRREFKVLTPMSISEEDEISLKRKVVENKKDRLEIMLHDKKEIENDEIIIPPEEKDL